MAYYRLEPFGEWRADVRSAMIALTLAKIFSKDSEELTLQDFMIEFGSEEAVKKEEEEAQADDSMLLAKVVAFNQLLGGLDLRQEPEE